MNFIKLFRKLGIIYMIILSLIMFFIVCNISVITILILLSFLFAYTIYSIYFYILLPIRRRDLKLNKIIESGDWKACLSDGWATQDYHLNEVCKIVQQCEKELRFESSVKMLDKQSQINALQSQINPHFLYNTLESIRGQAIIEEADEIAKMVEALSTLFRYSISQKDYLVTLRDEINNIKNYFSIQNYRFNNKFKLNINLDEEDNEVFDYYLPKLTIQPIVENAIYHGLETKAEEGKVIIDIIQTKSRLLITISDDGSGMDADTLETINQKICGEGFAVEEEQSSLRNGIALANVNNRIKIIFGEDYGIKLYSTLDLGTDVEITLPIVKNKVAFLQYN